MKNALLIAWSSLLLIISCENPAQDSPNTEVVLPSPDTTAARGVADSDRSATGGDFTIVPGVRAGSINADFTHNDLVRVFGANNVSMTEQFEGEGEDPHVLSVVYPNTGNELFIRWHPDQPLKKIASVRFESDRALWQTADGIKIGTTLEELVKINGKDFQFAGFEGDYAGRCNKWQGGAISSKVTVSLDPKKPEVVYGDQKLLGDGLFGSNHPTAKKADIRVLSVTVDF
jgi:hypothetical protein